MKKPLVTVGIPFFNAQSSLLDSIRSIFSQTVQDWELLLVDDGSTDESLQIAHSIDDPRITVLSDGQNRKLAARLNQIIKLAQGQYIARMDADDLSHPERFARQLGFLDSHKDVDVVGTSMFIFDGQGQPVSKIIVAETHEDMCRNRYRGFPIAHCTVMARSQWFRNNPYDENNVRNEDFELWQRTCGRSVFANIAEPLYFYNGFAGSSLPKYARSKHMGAKVIMKYAPQEIGKFRATYYAGVRYFQIAAYVGCTMLGLRNLFVRRLYLNLTQQEQQQAGRILDIIKKTELPVKNPSLLYNTKL